MIWCIGVTPYRGDVECRDCVIQAACNKMFLFLGTRSAAYEVSRLHRRITLTSARCRPQTEGHPEVSHLLKLGHLGPLFSECRGHLGIPKMIIPGRGHLQ